MTDELTKLQQLIERNEEWRLSLPFLPEIGIEKRDGRLGIQIRIPVAAIPSGFEAECEQRFGESLFLPIETDLPGFGAQSFRIDPSSTP